MISSVLKKKKRNKFLNIIAFFLILTATLIIYFPTLSNKFCLDDTIIFEASYPKNIKKLPDLFTNSVPIREMSYYRPITFLTFSIDYNFNKDNPLGYHITNIILAFITTLTVFFLLRHFLKAKQALFGSLVFIAFPGHSEAIINIFNRSQVISTFFTVTALLCILRVLKKKRPSRFLMFFSAFLTFLGCLAKESCLIIPGLTILIFMYFRPNKSLYKHLLGGFLLQICACLGYLLVRYKILGMIGVPGVDGFIKNRSLLNMYFNITKIFFDYLHIAIFPANLSCDYPIDPISGTHLSGFVFPLLICISVCSLLHINKKYRLFGFCFLWFLFTLIPVLHSIPIQIALAERLLFPAFIGMVIFIAALISKFRNGYPFIFICIIVFMGNITFHRCFDWHDNTTLWQQTLKTTPNSYRANIYLGNKAAKEQKTEMALDYYLEAANLKPNRNNKIILEYNKAVVYLRSNDVSKAITSIRKVLELAPNHKPSFLLLGDITARYENWQEALKYYNKANYSENNNRDKYIELLKKKGKCYIILRKWQKALETYEKLLKYVKKDKRTEVIIKLAFSKMKLKKYKLALKDLHGLIREKKEVKEEMLNNKIYFLLYLIYKEQGNKLKTKYYYFKLKKLQKK